MQQQLPTGGAPLVDTDLGSAPDRLLDEVIGQTPCDPVRADGIAVGSFDGIGADGSALVSIPTLGLSRVLARSISPLDPARLGHSLALAFEGGDPLKPIVLGMMMPAVLPSATLPEATEVLVDGERVCLTAVHEIELRCGEAAIVLSADGRIQLRGTYITSQASATQRILGGAVNIN